MIKTLRWILLIWTIVTFPYAVAAVVSFTEFFFVCLYAFLVIYLMIVDIK